MVYICWSLKGVDIRGYLIVGFIMLLLVIVMRCLLMFVDTIRQAKSFVLERTS